MKLSIGASIVVASLVAAAIPASARDLTYTVSKGRTISIGPWYHMHSGTCRMIEVPKIRILKQPQRGKVSVTTPPGKPVRPEQVRACPKLTLTQVWANYLASEAGADSFSFIIEYSPVLPGDWIYNVTVQVVE